MNISHLAGWKNSKPVRIGNGAAFHQQFDIYGELLDAIYLYNKYGKPVTWERWVAVRDILGKVFSCPSFCKTDNFQDYAMTIWKGKQQETPSPKFG